MIGECIANAPIADYAWWLDTEPEAPVISIGLEMDFTREGELDFSIESSSTLNFHYLYSTTLDF